MLGCDLVRTRQPIATANARSAGTGKEIIWLADDSPMAFVPAGSVEVEQVDPRLSKRKVETSAFYMDKYEVTSKRFAAFLNAMKAPADNAWFDSDGADIYLAGGLWGIKPGREEIPVEVTFDGALAYCKWAVKALPAWPEWLRAVRGDDGRRYPWGNKWDSSRCVCAATCDRHRPGPAPVGFYPSGASAHGVHDLAGNVSEWVVLPPFLQYRDALEGHVVKALAGGGLYGDSSGDVGEIFDSLGSAIHTAHCSVCRYATGFRCVVAADCVVLTPQPTSRGEKPR